MQEAMAKMRWVVAILGIAALVSCGASTPVTQPVTLSFSTAKIVMSTLSSVSLTVSGSDMTTITSTQSGPFTGDVSFSVNVPIGNARTFTATAAISNVTTEGYQGTTTSNISAAGGAIPITMLQMNFSELPATSEAGPQISGLSALYSNSDVAIFIDFTAAVDLNSISGVVEFIPDAATQFRSQSIINQLKGAIDVTMPSAGSSFMMFNATGTAITIALYDKDNNSVTVPVAANFQATLSGQSTIEIRMTQSSFSSLIDSGIDGKFNVLVGSLLSLVSPLTPTDTADFTPSSAAVDTGGGNVIMYNSAFDTTTLQ